MVRILVVDDIPDVRNSVQTLLEEEHDDWEIVQAGSSAQAVTALQRGSLFDVVITDMKIPEDAEGLDVIRAAKRRSPRIEVIVITVHEEREFQRKARGLGIWDYIRYPTGRLDPDDLVFSVERALEHKELTEQLVQARTKELRERVETEQKRASLSEELANMTLKRFWAAVSLGFISLVGLFLVLRFQDLFSDSDLLVDAFWAFFVLCFMAWATILGISGVQMGRFRAEVKREADSSTELEA